MMVLNKTLRLFLAAAMLAQPLILGAEHHLSRRESARRLGLLDEPRMQLAQVQQPRTGTPTKVPTSMDQIPWLPWVMAGGAMGLGMGSYIHLTGNTDRADSNFANPLLGGVLGGVVGLGAWWFLNEMGKK